MIARMRMTVNGPVVLGAQGHTMVPTRAARRSRPVVVVDEGLYCALQPSEWPTPLTPSQTLVARWRDGAGTTRRFAHATLGEVAAQALPGPPPLLVPRSALAEIRRRHSRPSIARAYRLRRSRFRPLVTQGARTLLALVAVICALSLSLVPWTLGRYRDSRDQLVAVRNAPGDTTPTTVPAPAPGSAPDLETSAGLPPARLLRAMVALLGPGQRVQHLEVEQDLVRVVVTGANGSEFASRLGTLRGVRLVHYESAESDHDVVTTISAQVEE